MLGVTLIDAAAFCWFLFCWVGYSLLADHLIRDERNLVTLLHEYRVLWMQRMLEREIRTGDVNIVATLIRGDALFASTAIFVLAGLVAVLGSLDEARGLVSEFFFAVEASRALWELKVLLLVMIFVYAFFKFAWSMRQFNFALVLIGAAPMPEDTNAPDRAAFPHRTALVITRGVQTLDRGLRAYYFGLAALSWLIQPWLFAVASVWVVLVLYRREFRSITLRALAEPVDNTKGH